MQFKVMFVNIWNKQGQFPQTLLNSVTEVLKSSKIQHWEPRRAKHMATEWKDQHKDELTWPAHTVNNILLVDKAVNMLRENFFGPSNFFLVTWQFYFSLQYLTNFEAWLLSSQHTLSTLFIKSFSKSLEVLCGFACLLKPLFISWNLKSFISNHVWFCKHFTKITIKKPTHKCCLTG